MIYTCNNGKLFKPPFCRVFISMILAVNVRTGKHDLFIYCPFLLLFAIRSDRFFVIIYDAKVLRCIYMVGRVIF